MGAATPSHFFDPFFDKQTTQSTGTLPIKGKGTVAVSSDANTLLRLSVDTELIDEPTLRLDVGLSEFSLYFVKQGKRQDIKYIVIQNENACFLRPGKKTTYWLSMDAHHGILRYGKYYWNKTMTLVEARLKTQRPDDWDDPIDFSWLEQVQNVKADQDGNKPTLALKIHRLPVVTDRSPFVLPPDEVTLLDLEKGTYIAPADLPEACRSLYENVAGTKIVLNDENFPQFTDAIQRSCITKGCWAYKALREKAEKNGSDLDRTYLRITLGYNLGDSPGVPYVLEIWPSQHHSPIHNHGKACAVIKVLHGDINCTFYDSLHDHVEIGTANLREGVVTWMGDEHNQIHQLHNKTPGVCCTIQCYRYRDEDNFHYDGFDVIGSDGKVNKFKPNSDKAFTEFREIMKEEWQKATQKE